VRKRGSTEKEGSTEGGKHGSMEAREAWKFGSTEARKHGSTEARKHQLIPISSSIIDIVMNSVEDEGFSVVIVGIGGISRSSSWLFLLVVSRIVTWD
jgi:hypothetical protein